MMPMAGAFTGALACAKCSVRHLMGFNSLESLTIPMVLQTGKLRYSEVKSFTCWPGPFLPSGVLFLNPFSKGRTKSYISIETRVE